MQQHPRQMSFDAGSTLYIGQAGSIYRGAFEASPKKINEINQDLFHSFFSQGVLQELKLSSWASDETIESACDEQHQESKKVFRELLVR